MSESVRDGVDRVILASSSPQRMHLLKRAVDRYEIMPSEFDETTVTKWPPEKHVMESAYGKAKDIASRVNSGIIIGADTVVVLDGMILGKPNDDDDAHRMLAMLSGRTHSVYTGVCIMQVSDGFVMHEMLDYEVTGVTFRRLNESEIADYIHTGEPHGRAGAYAIQEKGSGLVECFDGDYDNVVGLPVAKLTKMLEEMRKDES